MTPTGAWYSGRGLAMFGDEILPQAGPDFLELSRSDGAQTMAGTFMVKVMDALRDAAENDNLDDGTRGEAAQRLQRLLTLPHSLNPAGPSLGAGRIALSL